MISLSKKPFRQAEARFETCFKFQNVFDRTRKTTLTVFFHTIFPSESFALEVLFDSLYHPMLTRQQIDEVKLC